MSLYTDLDLSFTADIASKDLRIVEDDDAVIQSIRTLILTSYYERPFQPSLGSTIRRILFEQMDDITKLALAQSVKQTVDLFEPRAKVKYVDVYTKTSPSGNQIDDNTVVVVVSFFVYNRPNMVSSEFVLQRLR
jgi:phage baseplate assembly protein W